MRADQHDTVAGVERFLDMMSTLDFRHREQLFLPAPASQRQFHERGTQRLEMLSRQFVALRLG